MPRWPSMDTKTCTICGDKHCSRGWCRKHWQRWKKYGDPLAGGKPRPPTGGSLRWLEDVALKYKGDECLIWPFRRSGRGYASFTENGRSVYATRWICTKIYGHPPTDGHQAAHSCGKGHEGCVNPKHLRWATRIENDSDKDVHGTRIKGEAIPWSVLKKEQVQEIRQLRGRLSRAKIAERFGVSEGAISGIFCETTWRWLA